MEKFLSILSNFLIGICFLGVLAMFVAPPIFDITLNTVLSESMKPTLKMGGVIGVQKVDFSEIEVGDIISFRFPDQTAPVTHRIVEKVETEAGIGFKTKGDACEDPDPWIVKKDNLLGKIVFHLPWIGYFSKFFKTKLGFFLGMVLPAMVIVVLIVKDLFWPRPVLRRREKWPKKPARFPAYLCLAIGIVIIGALWGIMAGNIQEKTIKLWERTEEEKIDYISERNIHNKGVLPLVICFSSENPGIDFSENYFHLSAGEQKTIEITGDSEKAFIKEGALFPFLPQKNLYRLFCWNSRLAPLVVGATPIFPLTIVVFLVIWKISSKPPSLTERAKFMKRRLRHG